MISEVCESDNHQYEPDENANYSDGVWSTSNNIISGWCRVVADYHDICCGLLLWHRLVLGVVQLWRWLSILLRIRLRLVSVRTLIDGWGLVLTRCLGWRLVVPVVYLLIHQSLLLDVVLRLHIKYKFINGL